MELHHQAPLYEKLTTLFLPAPLIVVIAEHTSAWLYTVSAKVQIVPIRFNSFSYNHLRLLEGTAQTSEMDLQDSEFSS